MADAIQREQVQGYACRPEKSKVSNNGLQIVEVEKDLGVKISSDLKCSQQCMYAYRGRKRKWNY